MPEEKKPETTPEEEVDATEEEEETPESEEDTEEESEESGSEADEDTDQHLDWKKIAQDERDAREKAEQKLAERRFKGKKKKDEGDDEEKDDESERPITAKELEEILERDRQETRREVLSTQIKETARGLASSDDEANAIIEIHRNRTFPDSMPLEQQVREAYFIAHGPRMLAKNDELRRSMRGKNSTKPDSAENVHRDPPAKGEPKIPAEDRSELRRLGFAWDGKQYSKKLQNGKTLVKDTKSGKVFIQK